MPDLKQRGMGWLREPPDIRDHWIEFPKRPGGARSGRQARLSPALQYPVEKNEKVKAVAKSLQSLRFPFPPPTKVLSNVKWCSPIEDQGDIGSCTAQAGVGLLEYYEKRSFGEYVNGSRLFLYKMTRNLLGLSGDTGAYCRTTMAAMALLGVSLEKYWPYTDETPDYDREPTSFAYSLAQNYQSLVYHRADVVQSNYPLLLRLQMSMAVGLPLMFGFSCYESIWDAAVWQSGEIPWPTPGERRIGGHAVVAIGYDSNKKIKNQRPGGVQTTGAFLIRNSWGTDWGVVPPEAPADTTPGYGWLPYQYLSSGLASDWWSLAKAEWIDTGNFGI